MSLRFRRSVRLFPGVRLNFSRSGISTTVGVRGASMTLGPRGTYVNAGLPGTGLSYRTMVSPASRTPSVAAAPAFPESSPPEPIPPQPAPGMGSQSDAVEIRSAEVSALTSPGLGELKRLINEAMLKRRELKAAVAADRKTLETATNKLRFAQSFIIRIFTQKAVPALADAVSAAQGQLEDRTAELEGCVIEVDFAFDDATHGSYAALVRAFEALSSCQRIWDVTAVQATNRVLERTVATTSITRSVVSFDFTVPEIVKSSQQAMRMGNAAGRHIYLYPGFLIMEDGSGDFALIEHKELEASFSQSRFIEDETVPSDAELVGQTWAKANKDGSPDRRFRDNHAIPIVRYGELTFRSPTGLFEAYQFSDYDKASTFSQALSNHQRALAELAKKGGVAATDDHPEPEEQDHPAEPKSEPNEASPPSTPKAYPLDWAALIAGILALGAGANWIAHHPLSTSIVTPAAAAAPPIVASPTVQSVSHNRHKKRSHHVVRNSGE